MRKQDTAKLGRRDFFRKAGLGAGAIGITAAGLTAAAAEAAPREEPRKSAGYRETEHVKTFYHLARF